MAELSNSAALCAYVLGRADRPLTTAEVLAAVNALTPDQRREALGG